MTFDTDEKNKKINLAVEYSDHYSNVVTLITTSKILSFNCNSDNTEIKNLKIWYKIKRKRVGYYIKLYVNYDIHILEEPVYKYKNSIIVNKYFEIIDKFDAILIANKVNKMVYNAIENKKKHIEGKDEKYEEL